MYEPQQQTLKKHNGHDYSAVWSPVVHLGSSPLLNFVGLPFKVLWIMAIKLGLNFREVNKKTWACTKVWGTKTQDVIVDVLTLRDRFTAHNPVEKKEEKPKQK